MSLVADFHAAHKARLARMSANAIQSVKDDATDLAIAQLRQEITFLNNELKRQRGIVAEQNAYIEKLAGVAADTNPKLEEVLSSCCKYYSVSPNDMRSPTKALGIPFRRQVFYFLAREYGHSLHQIGRHIKKDHSCVLYGARKIQALLEDDEQLRDDIDLLRHKIAARVFERRRALGELAGSGA